MFEQDVSIILSKSTTGTFFHSIRMGIIGGVLKGALKTRARLKMPQPAPLRQQERVLRALLNRARDTQFGRYYGFGSLLNHPELPAEFARRVDWHDYNRIFDRWWSKQLAGQPDISWPGKTPYFALSSGTTGAPSKYIPVTPDMLRSMRGVSLRQMEVLAQYKLPSDLYAKRVLMLGGSTRLKGEGNHYYGDLSGITLSKVPLWFEPFFSPGRRIARLDDWKQRIEAMVKKAPEWDVWIVSGSSTWLVWLMEQIIERYQLQTIHDIWPNLKVCTYGGVSIQPYLNRLERCTAHPLILIETYLASEGFLAYDTRRSDIRQGMQLNLNNGIYFEFIPFNRTNFDEEGNPRPGFEALRVDQLSEGAEYAPLITTCAGAWRYLIGDTIRLTSAEHQEITLTGRTRQFLSLCGEHLSHDNMNEAILQLSVRLGVALGEFTVHAIEGQDGLGHHWYIGCDAQISEDQAARWLDEELSALNDDYAVERQFALSQFKVDFIPQKWFLEWMEQRGMLEAQRKFPRVVQGEVQKAWIDFMQQKVGGQT